MRQYKRLEEGNEMSICWFSTSIEGMMKNKIAIFHSLAFAFPFFFCQQWTGGWSMLQTKSVCLLVADNKCG